MDIFKRLVHTLPPCLQTLLQFRPSEASTTVIPEVSAAFIGKRPLLSCKVASLAGGQLVGAVAVSSHSISEQRK